MSEAAVRSDEENMVGYVDVFVAELKSLLLLDLSARGSVTKISIEKFAGIEEGRARRSILPKRADVLEEGNERCGMMV
tara:strand:- start:286 stop:519 length:234 start_codon:yes stop_codon:yes gene_type:complete